MDKKKSEWLFLYWDEPIDETTNEDEDKNEEKE